MKEDIKEIENIVKLRKEKCKGKVYYNINHFNKLLGKIIFKIKIEDV